MNNVYIKNGFLIKDNKITPGNILIQDGRIAKVEESTETKKLEKIYKIVCRISVILLMQKANMWHPDLSIFMYTVVADMILWTAQ